MKELLQEMQRGLSSLDCAERVGSLRRLRGIRAEVHLPDPRLGERIQLRCRDSVADGTIVEIRSNGATALLDAPALDIRIRAEVYPRQSEFAAIDPDLLGSCLNGFGELKARFANKYSSAAYARTPFRHTTPAPDVLERSLSLDPLLTGIASIDLFCTLAEGQRLALVAPPGAGKSTLLTQIIERSSVDISVLALIGERGREVRQSFAQLGALPNASRSLLIAAASDASARERIAAAEYATQYAEYFRAQGYRVLLIVDSLTRLARAWRDRALQSGEMIVRQGFPQSVYEQLPRLLERAGRTDTGSITALYSILAPEELFEDPLVEEVCSLTDGQLYLSRFLAQRGVYPAVDVPRSLSRLQHALFDSGRNDAVARLRETIACYYRDEEILLLNAATDESARQLKRQYEALLDILKTSTPYTEWTAVERLLKRLSEVISPAQTERVSSTIKESSAHG